MIVTLLTSAAAMLGGDVPVQPRAFQKVRSDGVTVVCVRHVEKPTIFTSRTQCKEPSEWSRADFTGLNRSSNSSIHGPDLDTFLSSPKPVPRIVGK